MKSLLTTFLILFTLFPVITGFVPLTARPSLRTISTIALHESNNPTDKSPMVASNATETEDVVARMTVEALEAMADEEDDDGNEEEEPQDQIFSPYSFWTERSGRYPRKMNE